MRCTLSSAGVPLGSVVIASADRTVARFDVSPAYAASELREVARAVGIAFHAIDWSSRLAPHVRSRALASAFARAHQLQSTLSLADERGTEVPVASILVIEFPHDPVPLGVVNFREFPSCRGAVLMRPSRTPGARHMLSGRSGSIVEAPQRDRPIPERSE